MSEATAKDTENAVLPNPEAASRAASQVGGEKSHKRNSTSRSERRPSLHSHPSSPLPECAPVLGAGGIVLEPEENALESAKALQEHAVIHDSHRHDEKITHVVGEKGSTETEATQVKQDGGETGGETTEESGEEDDMVYPGGGQLALLTFGLCIATFTMALDNTIIATAIPKITTVFDSLGDVGWYGSSYLLTTTALQPSFGRVYTYFSIKRTYLFALVLFELGSVLCAAAKDSPMLIVGRAVAGAGASALFSGGMTIIGFTVPLKKRPMFIAAISSMFGIASVVGPLLGGVFTDRLTWRWCFWINLPFGAISFATVAIFFKTPERKHSGLSVKQRILEIDLLGALFLIAAIVCLLLALQWGGTVYSWKSSKVWGCILGFGLLISIFIAQQFRRGDRATIPPRVFKQRTVLFSCLFSCFMSMGLYTHIFYLPFFFQAVKGTTAEGSGIRTIPYLGSIIVSSVFAGAGITIFGFYKPFMIAAGAIFTVGAGMLYTLKVNSSAGIWIGYELLSAIGAGFGVQIPFIAVQVVLNSKDMPTGNAIAIFFNSLGGAVAISIAQNIFSNGLSKNLPIYAPDVSASVVINAGATHLRDVVTAQQLPGVLQAYMIAINQSFILAIVCGGLAAIFACFVEWKSVKGKKIIPAGG